MKEVINKKLELMTNEEYIERCLDEAVKWLEKQGFKLEVFPVCIQIVDFEGWDEDPNLFTSFSDRKLIIFKPNLKKLLEMYYIDKKIYHKTISLRKPDLTASLVFELAYFFIFRIPNLESRFEKAYEQEISYRIDRGDIDTDMYRKV